MRARDTWSPLDAVYAAVGRVISSVAGTSTLIWSSVSAIGTKAAAAIVAETLVDWYARGADLVVIVRTSAVIGAMARADTSSVAKTATIDNSARISWCCHQSAECQTPIVGILRTCPAKVSSSMRSLSESHVTTSRTTVESY